MVRISHLPAIFLFFAALLSGSFAHAQWTDVGPGMVINPDSPRNFFSISPVGEEGLWAAPVHPTFQDVRELAHTSDGGNTWDILTLPETDGNHLPVRIEAVSDAEAWVLALRYPSPGRAKLFHTTDSGQTWTDVPGPFNEQGKGVQNVHFFNALEGIVFGSPRTGSPSVDMIKIFRTADGGDTWQELFDPQVPAPIQGDSYFLLSGNDTYAAVSDTLWFVTTENNIYRTADRGASWQRFSVGLPGSSTVAGLASVAFRDALQGMIVSFQPQQAAVTVNGGSSWTQISAPESPTARCVQYIPGTEGTYVVTDGYEGNSQEIAITFDHGQTWESWEGNPGMNCVAFTSLTSGWGGANVNASSGGIFRWEADLGTILNVKEEPGLKAVIFPNPARDQIQVKTTGRVFTDVRAEIFNLSGSKVEEQHTAGYGEFISVDIHNLPQGMYILVLTSGAEVINAKFVKTD